MFPIDRMDLLRQNSLIPLSIEESSMKRVKRTAVTVIPKHPYINWANSVNDGHVKLEDNPSPEHTIYLVEDVTDYVVDTVEIIKPILSLSSWKNSIAGTACNRHPIRPTSKQI